MKIAIIGGGAGGLAAASACAEHAQVTIYEKQPRLGRKLLATGNGRCNLTNQNTDLTHFHGKNTAFAQYALEAFPPEKVEEIFASLGVATVLEDWGRVFPRSGQAQAVLDNLRLFLQLQGVEEMADTPIKSIIPTKGGFNLVSEKGKFFADKVIIASGSAAAPNLGGSMDSYRLLTDLGHQLVPVSEAIVQLKSSFGAIKALSGQKFNGTAQLIINDRPQRKEAGEILFTDYGLSGLPILQLSAQAVQNLNKKKDVTVALDLIPDYSLEEFLAYLTARKNMRAKISLEDFLTGFFSKRIAQQLIKAALNTPLSRLSASLSAKELEALASTAKAWRFAISGSMGLKNAQAASGGIATADFDPETMESKLIKNLYACGEVLDITGDCGGFNLQWAWASGFLAGFSAAENTV